MYVPARFAMAETDALAFAAQRGFGLLVAHDGGRPVGSHLPFVLRQEGGRWLAQVHVANGNPLRRLADGRACLLAVSGMDAYVSNDWYVTPDQVSTWLYEAVHLTGPVRVVADGNRAHGDAMLSQYEGRLAPKAPWRLAMMEPGKRAAMLGAITTLEMTIETVEGQRKLNQHKPDADHVAVADALDGRGGPAQRSIAASLRALRPGLRYRALG